MRGSVACDIVPRRDRQFSVVAANVRVQVTGTQFSVSYNPESGNVEVEVQRGSVNVTTANSAAQERHLGAGEHWSVRGGTPNQADAPSVSAESTAATPSAIGSSAQTALDDAVSAPESARPGDTTAPVPQELPSAHALMDQGNRARRAGDARGAANAYQALLTRFPRDPRAGLAAFELGRLRMGPLGDAQGAVRAFQSAVALSPGATIKEDSMAHLVEAYAVSGQSAQCTAARDAYLKGYPNGVHASAVRRQCGGT